MVRQILTSTPGTDTAAVAVYATHDLAEAAVKELASARFDITKISVVGRGFHTEDHVAGFYSKGDRIKVWGSNGAFWGGIWGLLLGGTIMAMPVVGPVIVAGHLAIMIAAGVETALVVGGLSALGAALYGMGIPKDDVIRYERAVKEDRFLVIVHGASRDVEQARDILANGRSIALDFHEHVNMHAPLEVGTRN